MIDPSPSSKNPQSPREGTETYLASGHTQLLIEVRTPNHLARVRKQVLQGVSFLYSACKNPQSPREGTANWGNYDVIFKIGLDI